MGFLDKKERILDIVLTEEGKKLLSQNDLDFTYYSFSDDGIDYSGSLNDAKSRGMTLDKYIPKEGLLEAVSRNDSIKYNLYTFDETSDVLPVFKIKEEDLNSGLNFSLDRWYTLPPDPESFADAIRGDVYRKTNSKLEDVSAIIRADVGQESEDTRNEDKAITDLTTRAILNMENNKIVAGSVLGRDFIAINEVEVVDRKSGEIKKISEIDIKTKAAYFTNINEKKIEVVTGLDSVVLHPEIKDASGKVNQSGVIISVYESGSDGTLKKMPAEDTIRDVESGEIVEEGFLNYLQIIVDENEEV